MITSNDQCLHWCILMVGKMPAHLLSCHLLVPSGVRNVFTGGTYMGVYKGGGGGFKIPHKFSGFFLKSEGKEIERKKKMLGGGGGTP